MTGNTVQSPKNHINKMPPKHLRGKPYASKFWGQGPPPTWDEYITALDGVGSMIPDVAKAAIRGAGIPIARGGKNLRRHDWSRLEEENARADREKILQRTDFSDQGIPDLSRPFDRINTTQETPGTCVPSDNPSVKRSKYN